MNTSTANLDMPYILPSQAQKHVSHNEALQRLDAIVQMTLAATSATPPADAPEGACYRIAVNASEGWAGREGRIALRQDGAWLYLAPRRGWRAWDAEAGRLIVFDGTGWAGVPLPDEATCRTLGVSTTADAATRLAVASPATMFTHEGNDHRLKINKATEADTASLIFQSGWTGHAEIGLTGDNTFSLKVSDGTDWITALSVAPSGEVRRPRNAAFAAWRDAGTANPADGTTTGFDQIANLQGTATLGPGLSQGAALVVPSTGLYLLALRLVVLSTTGFEVALQSGGTTTLATCRGGNTGAVATTLTTFALAVLTAGETISLLHNGSATFEHGSGRTGLSGVML